MKPEHRATGPKGRKQERARTMKRPLLLILTMAVLLCGCQPNSGGPTTGQTPDPSATGTQANADRGEPCPSFNLTSPDGSSVKFDPNNNPDKEVYLLLFWSFRWDPNVKELMSRMSELHERCSPRGLNIIAITYDEEPDAVRKYLAGNQLPFQVAIGTAGTYDRFGLKSIPTAFLVDAKGKIVERWTGYYTTEEFSQAITPYLPGRPGN